MLAEELKNRVGGWISRHSERFLTVPQRGTLQIRGLGLTKIPLIFFVAPSVVEATDERCEIVIPLSWRTRNHLKCMYFGALAVGADVAGGLIAWRLIESTGNQLNLIFQDFHAEFLKRAEGDVHFACEDGVAIREMVDRALATGERVNHPVVVLARVPSRTGDEPVARFTLTLSLKRKK